MLLKTDSTKAQWKRVNTTAPMDNVKSLLIDHTKTNALAKELDILMVSWLTESNGFGNAHTVSCGCGSTLEMAWILKNLWNFWCVLLIFTSYVTGKLPTVGTI